MSHKSALSKWLVEFTTPVVVTVTTEKAEQISMKNGLLFHELLSAFGHLDNMSCTTRSVNHQIPVVDAHIRFERVSEVIPKNERHVEKMLVNSFSTFDISKLPSSPGEVRQMPPSGWSSLTEQVLLRSMSFTEYEMNSHPLLFLTVISTADTDHIACMQELTSYQHIPACYSTGQYDPNIHRVYLLLHDSSDPSVANVDKDMILRQLKSKFSPTHTKMLSINSLPADSPNLQHPDIWGAYRFPVFFPQYAPKVEETSQVVGSHLSMEDFISLRNFCIELFQQEVLPAYERRVSALSRIVTETKKGMRNVIKNFWRKPQAQEIKKGTSRYRYDKIEAQILLLADTAFNMRDYEAALSMYKLVKDDFKADKSVLHIAHITLMTAACQRMLEPNARLRDVSYYSDALGQMYAASKMETFPLQVYAYYAFLMSEILITKVHPQSPLDAAHLLLQASSYTSKSLPLLSALLIERASYCYLQAGQERKFSLQIVLTGQRFQSLGAGGGQGTAGTKPTQQFTKHACVCFATAMIFHDRGKWGTVKSRLWRSLADKLREASVTEAALNLTESNEVSGEIAVDCKAKQALLFLLHILRAVSPTDDTFSGTVALLDAVNAYHELVHADMWNGVTVSKGWEDTTTRAILLNETSHAFQELRNKDMDINSDGLTVVEDLRIPEIITSSVILLSPLNGSSSLVPHGSTGGQQNIVNMLRGQLDVEIALEKEQILLNITRSNNTVVENAEGEEDVISLSSSSYLETNSLLLESWADKYLESNCSTMSKLPGWRIPSQIASSSIFTVPIGEIVTVAMTISNTLPVELILRDFKMILRETDATTSNDDSSPFEVSGIDIVLPSGQNQNVNLLMKPRKIGLFSIIGASYVLGDKIQVIQHIDKPGPLLLKTQKQRAEGQRGKDETLIMKVIDSSPCLCVTVNKGNPVDDILCGEIFETSIELHNEGSSPAVDISFIFDYPIGVVKFESDEAFLPFFGQSCTAMRLPQGTTILPGQSVHLNAWFRLSDAGTRDVSMLVQYQQPGSSSSRQCFTNFQVTVSSAISTALSIVGSRTESLNKTIVVDILNTIENSFSNMDETESGDEDGVQGGSKENIPKFMINGGESCAAIDSVLVVGDIYTPNTVLGTLSSDGESCLINADERMNLFIPIVLHSKLAETEVDENGEEKHVIRHYNSTWKSTISEDYDKSVESRIPTYDMFSYLSFCKSELQCEIHRAEERRRQAELSGEEFTPRTISQVRRARTSELQSSNSNNSPNNSPRSANMSRRGRNHHLLDVIATAEVEHNEATVVIAWSCYWRGKRHHGLNILHNQKLFRSEFVNDKIPDPLKSVSAPTLLRGYSDSSQNSNLNNKRSFSLASQYAADRLTVTLVVPQTVSWDFSANGRCPVKVSLDIYSNHPEESILVSVDALEWIDLNSDTISNPSKGGSTSSRSRKRPPVKGLRWEGKSRFVDIVIPPLSSVSFPFLALIAKEGVYDIKRFRVTVSPISNMDSSSLNVTPFIKLLQGQSLVNVADSGSD